MASSMVKRDAIVRLFTEEHLTTRQIGERVGMTHAGVQWHLKRAGVSAQQGTWVTRACTYCGKPVARRRSKARKTATAYCRPECYYAQMQTSGYQPWRQGCRIARAVVAEYVELEPEWVVHHWDGNNRNNVVTNLAVFASQSEHMRFHRGGKVRPVWDGRELLQ